jgi:hypothetical protein
VHLKFSHTLGFSESNRLPFPFLGAALDKKVDFMNATHVSFGLFIVLLTILLTHWMRKLTPLCSRLRRKDVGNEKHQICRVC